MEKVGKRRRVIEKPASGVDCNGSAEPVVEFGEDSSFHYPGPNSSRYEDAKKGCGAHLVFNAFWMISNF